MELQIIGLAAAAGLLIHAIYLRICCFKHDAVCLEWTPHGKYLKSSVQYEYELVMAGKKVTYKSWGRTYFYPRKGKRYKILISKKDYYKVYGYMLYVVHLLEGGFFCAAIIVMEILYH